MSNDDLPARVVWIGSVLGVLVAVLVLYVLARCGVFG